MSHIKELKIGKKEVAQNQSSVNEEDGETRCYRLRINEREVSFRPREVWWKCFWVDENGESYFGFMEWEENVLSAV